MSAQLGLWDVFQEVAFKKAEALVSGWDFSLTVAKLQELDYAGWTKERAELAEKNYKRYLAVTKALDGYQLVPNGDVDRFWHEHILDTRRYAKDCYELCGGFLHHYPFFGMNGDADNKNWINAAEQSTTVWNRLFGEHLYRLEVAAPQKCPQACPGIEGAIQAAPQKCPQACPGIEGAIQAAPQKCPQACPGIEGAIQAAPQKCPQACPGIDGAIQAAPQKCPQACPGITGAIDTSYRYLPKFDLRMAA